MIRQRFLITQTFTTLSRVTGTLKERKVHKVSMYFFFCRKVELRHSSRLSKDQGTGKNMCCITNMGDLMVPNRIIVHFDTLNFEFWFDLNIKVVFMSRKREVTGKLKLLPVEHRSCNRVFKLFTTNETFSNSLCPKTGSVCPDFHPVNPSYPYRERLILLLFNKSLSID